MTNSILKSRDITLLKKVCLVFPVVMYGCESYEERFGTVTLLLTAYVPLLLLLASVGKELRFHLYFLAETDPVSRPLCAGGEKGKVDVPTHQDKEP